MSIMKYTAFKVLIVFIVCVVVQFFTFRFKVNVVTNKYYNNLRLNLGSSSEIDTDSKVSFENGLQTYQPQKQMIWKSSLNNGIFVNQKSDSLRSLSLIEDSSGGSILYSSKLFQNTNGPLPRSYLPSILVLYEKVEKIYEKDVQSLLEESIKWYLDGGGRLSTIDIVSSFDNKDFLKNMGFEESIESSDSSDKDKEYIRSQYIPPGFLIFSCDAIKFKTYCETRIVNNEGDKHALYDIIGRIMHNMGDPKAAIKHYTQALQLQPQSAATFRNLGSAYHAAGDMQLAFASYQQTIQLDPKDPLVYLKLAFFYEDFATKDWVDAETHSKKCYEYYLDNVDPEDINILTRLGNLLVREHMSMEAITVYDKILKLDSSLKSIWFNKAHAHVKIDDVEGAIISLQKTLELDNSITAARHMLKALTESDALKAVKVEEDYIKDLFNSYAETYDSHGKKLLYSAPRVIRQELAKIYKSRFSENNNNIDSLDVQIIDNNNKKEKIIVNSLDKDFVEANAPVGSSCSSYTSFMNNSLDILDIGCGTGLAGAWLKDYAKSLVGVDISEQMVNVARKKMLYQDIQVMPISQYLEECTTDFDIVVAADVLSYIGELSDIFDKVKKILRSKAVFVFTIETADNNTLMESGKGFRLLKSGRFGYSREYINNLISKCLGPDFAILMSRDYSPRLESGEPVPGILYIIQRE